MPRPLPPAAEVSGEFELVVAEEGPADDQEPGGGSIEPGQAEVAEGTAPEPPKPLPVVAARVPPPPVAAEPTPPEVAPEQTPEHTPEPGDDVAEPEDLFALDTLLTAEQGNHEVEQSVKPRPAWRSVTEPKAQAAPMAGEQARLSRHPGSGQGNHGGPGGHGHGSGAPDPVRAAESPPFGGSSGAFHGKVCFIPRGTRSLRSLGNCDVQHHLYTDVFNTPTTVFTEGFSGVPRTEWFAIRYDGKFRTKKSGMHHFRLASDDGSILEIDGELVIDHDGLHGPVVKRGKAELRAGEHSFTLRYFQGPRAWVALQLWVTPPGGSERLFGPSF